MYGAQFSKIKNYKNLSKETNRFHSIDFLRGIAILGVIAVHTTQLFPSKINSLDSLFGMGRYGVQLFFLVSAITMCYMWSRREGELNPVKNFYIRRLLRIAPLFWLAMPIYLLIYGVGSNYWAPEGIGLRQVILTALFLHGFWPDAINSVVPGGWSIAVEMTFYLIFPLLIIKFKDRKNLYLYLGISIWIFNIIFFKKWATLFFAEYYQSSSETIIQDYLSLNFISQAPVFLLGCYLYFSLNEKDKKFNLIIFIGWIMLGIILKYLFDINGLGFLLSTLFLAFFSYTCVLKKINFYPLEALGKKSYSIYLIHFLVLYSLEKVLPENSGSILELFIAIGLTTLISYGISIFVYRLFEVKLYKLANRFTHE